MIAFRKTGFTTLSLNFTNLFAGGTVTAAGGSGAVGIGAGKNKSSLGSLTVSTVTMKYSTDSGSTYIA